MSKFSPEQIEGAERDRLADMAYEQHRKLHLLLKYYGLVQQMRQHQLAYFRNRTDFDKRCSMRFEGLVDEYAKVLKRAGIEPIIESDTQKPLF